MNKDLNNYFEEIRNIRSLLLEDNSDLKLIASVALNYIGNGVSFLNLIKIGYEILKKYENSSKSMYIFYLKQIFTIAIYNQTENKKKFTGNKSIATHEVLNQEVDNFLKILDKKEQDIIKVLFGLDDGQKHTLEETALKFNLTKERIKQIKLKALDKLKNNK